jgi:hypothetical protein
VVEPDRLDDLVSDRSHRIESRGGLLENQADPRASDAAPFAVRQTEEISSGVDHPSADSPPFRHEAEDRSCELRLAASALPHHRHRFAGFELERNAVDGRPESSVEGQLDAKIFDHQQR